MESNRIVLLFLITGRSLAPGEAKFRTSILEHEQASQWRKKTMEMTHSQ
jgi:hypothetical protein